MGWLTPTIEKWALRGTKGSIFSFPEELNNIDNTIILWPSIPDEAAFRMASEIKKALGERLKAVVGYGGSNPIDGVKYIELSEENVGILGVPKRSIVGKIAGYNASIDLSPEFELRLSILPIKAEIRLRIGRDATRAGKLYNIIFKGDTGTEILSLIDDEKEE